MNSNETQRKQALERANAVRHLRAESKKAIHEGRMTVVDVLSEIPPYMESMKIVDLLRCQRMWGEAKSIQFLRHVHVSPQRRLINLARSERLAICKRYMIMNARLEGARQMVAADKML